MAKTNYEIKDVVKKFQKASKEEVERHFTSIFNELVANSDLRKSDIAEMLGVDDSMVDKYLNISNSSKPKMDGIVTIAKLFGVTTDYLCVPKEQHKPFSTEDINTEYIYRFLDMATKLGFNIELNDNVVVFENTNKNIISAFEKLVDKDKNIKSLEEISKNANSLISFCGKIMPKQEFETLRQMVYLYSHNMELYGTITIDDIITEVNKAAEITDTTSYIVENEEKEEQEREKENKIIYNDEEFGKKLDEWNNTNGNPKQYISDEYYDIFLSDEK